MNARLAVAVSAALALAASAAAQIPPLAPEFQVNSFTTSDQVVTGAAMNRAGRFVVCWQSDGQDGSGDAAMARLFDETQTPATPELQVNTFTTGDQSYPSVAMDDSGRFVVVWSSYGQDGSDIGVFARRYDEAGNPLGAEIPVNTYTTEYQSEAVVATDPAGNFVVVWTSFGQDGSGNTTVGRRFDRTGAALGPEFVVNTFTTAAQYAEGVAVDAAGNFVVVWAQIGGGSFGIVGRRYDNAGNALGDPFPVSTYFNNIGFARVAGARDGSFVVVWTVHPPGTTDADVMARAYDSSGSPLGGEFVVNQSTAEVQRFPEVAVDPDGNFTVVWQSPDADSDGIRGRRYDRFGAAVSDEFPVNSTTALAQFFPFVSASGAGDLVVGWGSDGQDGSDSSSIARRSGLTAYAGAEVDVNSPAALTAASNLNGVLETGETVVVEPTWTNRTSGDLAVTGTATDLSGPAGATYTLDVAFANYGTIGAGGAANCYDATSVCYVVTVPTPAARPAAHWDARLQEKLANGVPKTWSLHIGGSFPDVPQNSFYPFIENLFHNGVTGGCFGGGYCPGNNVTRAQMAVFLLKSKFSAGYVPPPATGTVFTMCRPPTPSRRGSRTLPPSESPAAAAAPATAPTIP